MKSLCSLASDPHFTPWTQSYPTGQWKLFCSHESILLVLRPSSEQSWYCSACIVVKKIAAMYLYFSESWLVTSLALTFSSCSVARPCLCVKISNFMLRIMVIRSHIEVQNQENMRLQSGWLSSKWPVQHNQHRWVIKFKRCERKNPGVFYFFKPVGEFDWQALTKVTAHLLSLNQYLFKPCAIV